MRLGVCGGEEQGRSERFRGGKRTGERDLGREEEGRRPKEQTVSAWQSRQE